MADRDIADDGEAKRLRPVPEALGQPPAQQHSWNPPSASQLYANGLMHKAEAVSSSTASWTVDGAAMRRENFSSADVSGAELKQRQAEARRMLLRK